MKIRAQSFRTLLRLRAAEQAAFVQAWLYLTAAKIGIQTLGVARTLRLLGTHEQQPTRRVMPAAAPWLKIAARYVPGGANCLSRSVALIALLQRSGIPSELRIGIGKTDPDLDAHAWVEIDGIPVNDAADVRERFSAFTMASQTP